MTHDCACPESAADDHPRLARRFLNMAEELTAAVFRHADREHPAMAALHALGSARRAELLAQGSQDPDLRREQRFFLGLTPRSHAGPKARRLNPGTLVSPDMELPSPPRIYAELCRAIADPYTSGDALAGIIANDMALAARVLRLVNSPYFGVGRRVDSVATAVGILGTRQVSIMAAAMCVMSEFKGIPKDLIDLESFWRHGIAVGVLARCLARRADAAVLAQVAESADGGPDVGTEQFFLAGLLHDVGRLLLFRGRPEVARRALLRAREEQLFLYDTEQEEIGCDHATLGSMLLRQWNLPPALRLAVLYHHIPDVAEAVAPNAVIHLADIMSRALGYGISGEYFVPSLSEAAWASLELGPQDLEQAAREAGEVLEPLFAAMG